MILKNLKKSLLFNFFLVLLIFLLDRVSKLYIIYLDNKFLGSEIFSSKFLNIILVWNDGIAFGLLSFKKESLYDILSVIILIIILILIFMIIKSYGFKKYSFLIILGGALGNFFDRVFYRAVPDFIDFHIGNLHWFVFNVADIFITIGVIFMIILELFDNNKKNLDE
tara:strand:+ start:1073 stop:1573 length:501 start_codon:yes stop_codon:yes gene_type:complete